MDELYKNEKHFTLKHWLTVIYMIGTVILYAIALILTK